MFHQLGYLLKSKHRKCTVCSGALSTAFHLSNHSCCECAWCLCKLCIPLWVTLCSSSHLISHVHSHWSECVSDRRGLDSCLWAHLTHIETASKLIYPTHMSGSLYNINLSIFPSPGILLCSNFFPCPPLTRHGSMTIWPDQTRRFYGQSMPWVLCSSTSSYTSHPICPLVSMKLPSVGVNLPSMSHCACGEDDDNNNNNKTKFPGIGGPVCCVDRLHVFFF